MDIILLGFPRDEGVARNGGRPGASSAPATFRQLLRRCGAVDNRELNIDLSRLSVGDLGDVSSSQLLPDIEEAWMELEAKVLSILDDHKAIPFVIGGGNDQSFSNASALLRSAGAGNVGVINIDAHFDVRPQKNGLEHSGSPFRQLLETQGFKGQNFVEFAAQGTQCSAVHADYITSKGGRIHWLSQIKKDGVVSQFVKILDSFPENVFVSFDLDSVRGSDAPGVSAPGVIGLSAQEALEICFEAGRCPKVKLFDLSEFNPTVEDYRTGKLVTNMFVYFAMGVARRGL
eukprot:TRINITY_DN6303_c0_g1_i1.p2 TRINITY_DN6303_c0_g1~~TRINITY_DN6303_c0_g1_i1.p2  ORF type:complete len:316 (-),score=121.55 TRINITY_DN6303_c0_g1_i1:1-864(-)